MQQPLASLLLLAFFGASTWASSLGPPRHLSRSAAVAVHEARLGASQRIRGGQVDLFGDEDDESDDFDGSPEVDASEDDPPPADGKGLDSSALTDDEIMAKLNEIPTFVLMAEGGGFIALRLQEGSRAICFFTEPEEAKAVLNMTQTKDAETSIKLACVGLGNALKLCRDSVEDEETKAGFAEFDGHLRVQGMTRLVKEMEPQLKSMLETAGIAQDSPWQLPVFICDQVVGKDMLPVFLNPREIRSAWLANGRKEEDLPEKYVMIDIRMMMADMKKPGSPWKHVKFIGPEGSAELANQLQAEGSPVAA